MYITHVFRDSGSPESGLTPTITIYDLSDNRIVVNKAVMTEVGTSGIYKYNFTGYSPLRQYVWLADGGSTLQAFFDTANAMSSERYPAGRLDSDNQYFNIRDIVKKLSQGKV